MDFIMTFPYMLITIQCTLVICSSYSAWYAPFHIGVFLKLNSTYFPYIQHMRENRQQLFLLFCVILFNIIFPNIMCSPINFIALFLFACKYKCIYMTQTVSLSIDLVIDIQLLWFPGCYEQGSSICEHAVDSTVMQHTFLNFITHILGSWLCFLSFTLWNVTGTISILFLWL